MSHIEHKDMEIPPEVAEELSDLFKIGTYQLPVDGANGTQSNLEEEEEEDEEERLYKNVSEQWIYSGKFIKNGQFFEARPSRVAKKLADGMIIDVRKAIDDFKRVFPSLNFSDLDAMAKALGEKESDPIEEELMRPFCKGTKPLPRYRNVSSIKLMDVEPGHVVTLMDGTALSEITKDGKRRIDAYVQQGLFEEITPVGEDVPNIITKEDLFDDRWDFVM